MKYFLILVISVVLFGCGLTKQKREYLVESMGHKLYAHIHHSKDERGSMVTVSNDTVYLLEIFDGVTECMNTGIRVCKE